MTQQSLFAVVYLKSPVGDFGGYDGGYETETENELLKLTYQRTSCSLIG